MNMNFLLLNADKTELLVIRPHKFRHLDKNLKVNMYGCKKKNVGFLILV